MKYTIRDLLLVTVIVALAVGWAVDHWRQAARAAKWKERALIREAMPKTGIPLWKDDDGLLPKASAPAPHPPKE